MKNYYFTFGQDHHTIDGYPMKDYWVRVAADDASKARLLFISEFSSITMPATDKWAFQYDEKDFNKEYFPKGEYQFIADLRQDQPHWWGYEHVSGTLQAKPFYTQLDLTEAESSPFVAQVVYPFLANSRDEALEYIKKQVKN